MCIHDQVDVKRSLEMRAGTNWAVMWFESPDGRKVRGVDCIRYNQAQDIANCIRNVRNWHPEVNGPGWVLHMEDVNLKRYMEGLPMIKESDLPLPSGKPPRSNDVAEAAA